MNLQEQEVKSTGTFTHQIQTQNDESQIWDGKGTQYMEQLKKKFKIKKTAQWNNMRPFSKQLVGSQNVKTMFNNTYYSQKPAKLPNSRNDSRKIWTTFIAKKSHAQNQMELMDSIAYFKNKLVQSSHYKSVFRHEDILKLKQTSRYFKQDYFQSYLEAVFAVIDDMIYVKNGLLNRYQSNLKQHMSSENYCFTFDDCRIKFMTNDCLLTKLLKIIDKYDMKMVQINRNHEQEKSGKSIQSFLQSWTNKQKG